MTDIKNFDRALKHHLEEDGPNVRDSEWDSFKKITKTRKLKFENSEFFFKYNVETDEMIVKLEDNVDGYSRNDFETIMQKVTHLIENLKNEGKHEAFGFFEFLTEEEKCIYSIVRHSRHWG
jgi:hypothetical protein